jgi:hypothetical protein
MLGSREAAWFGLRTEEKTVGEFTDAAGAARLGLAAHLRAVTAGRRAETDVAVIDANRLHAAARDLAGFDTQNVFLCRESGDET